MCILIDLILSSGKTKVSLLKKITSRIQRIRIYSLILDSKLRTMKNNKAITVVKQLINNHKNLILLIMIFQIAYSSKGQNLVPNPSFEDTSSCPNQLNQVYRAT